MAAKVSTNADWDSELPLMMSQQELQETSPTALCNSNPFDGSYLLRLILGQHHVTDCGILPRSLTRYL